MREISIEIDQTHSVSGIVNRPPGARALYVLAHGAGAGMNHPFMELVARGLAARGIATLRFQFPFMEQGSKRPDNAATAQLTVRAAVAEAACLAPDLPLFAGGKSFGGRMTSQAQAESPLLGVRGLIFLGFPLHPAGKPAVTRAEHLSRVDLPMLFIQGTRDALADLELLRGIVGKLGDRATLHLLRNADHSFHTPARSGPGAEETETAMVDAVAHWIESVNAGRKEQAVSRGGLPGQEVAK